MQHNGRDKKTKASGADQEAKVRVKDEEEIQRGEKLFKPQVWKRNECRDAGAQETICQWRKAEMNKMKNRSATVSSNKEEIQKERAARRDYERNNETKLRERNIETKLREKKASRDRASQEKKQDRVSRKGKYRDQASRNEAARPSVVTELQNFQTENPNE